MTGKSQLLVCGAAISTYLSYSGVSPTIFQPVSFRHSHVIIRNSGVMIGVLKTVRFIMGAATFSWAPGAAVIDK